MKADRSAVLLPGLCLALLGSAPLHGAEVSLDPITVFPFAAGEAANGDTSVAHGSADGRFVLVTTRANNLAAGIVDGNQADDVYLLDRESGLFDLISRSAAHPQRTDGTAGRRSSGFRVSEDGRYVVFQSESEALIAGGTYPAAVAGEREQVYLFDRTTRATQLVSHAPGQPATAADRASAVFAMTPDGRFVAFHSRANNLVAGASGNNLRQAYLFDRNTGESTLISHPIGSPGTLATGGDSTPTAISPDGRFLLFNSAARDLIAGYANSAAPNAFVYDRQSGSVEMLTRSPANATFGIGGRGWAISNDGRYVLIETLTVGLQAGVVDSNANALDLYLFDRQIGSAQLISHSAASSTATANAGSTSRWMSEDGRYVYFTSAATDLVAGFADNNGTESDVYLYDRQTQAVILISHAAGSPTQGGNGYSLMADGNPLSPDGRYALLRSAAGDLAGGTSDGNGETDIYLYDRQSAGSTLVSRVGGSLAAGTGDFYAGSLVQNDGAPFFGSEAALDPASPDPYGESDVYRFDPAGPGVELVSATPLAGKSTPYDDNEIAAEVLLDKTGRWATWGPYLWDGKTGAIELIAHAAGSPATSANAAIYTGPVTPDGRFVSYSTTASNVVGGLSGGGGRSVYFYDRNIDTAFLLSHRHDAPTVRCNGDTVVRAMTDDARRFFLESQCDQLIAGLTGGAPGDDVFLYDRAPGGSQLISHGFSSVLEMGDEDSVFLEAGADLSWVVYRSGAYNLVPGFVDHNDVDDPELQAGTPEGILPVHDLYYYDRVAREAKLVTRRPGTTNDGTEGEVEEVRASANGSSVFFVSWADDLVAGQTPQPLTYKIYRWNRATGANELVVPQPGNPLVPCSGSVRLADVTPDGRFVLFHGTCQLVPGDVNATSDTYLLDRQSGQIELISHLPGLPGTSAGVGSAGVTLSPDGRRVAYRSGGVPYTYDRASKVASPLAYAHYDASELVPAAVVVPWAKRPQASADGTRILLQTEDARLAPFDANSDLDHFRVTIGDLFADGFESGDTGAWSAQLP